MQRRGVVHRSGKNHWKARVQKQGMQKVRLEREVGENIAYCCIMPSSNFIEIP